MHIRSFPPTLRMTTGLANHRVWWTFRMNPTSSSFLIFFADEVLSLNELLLGLLLHRPDVRIDLQMMLNHLHRNSKYL
jgi:hypothetical protein